MGQKIALKAKDTDPDTAQEVMKIVQKMLKRSEKRLRTGSAHQVAHLALVDLAEKYVSSRDKTLALKADMVETSERIFQIVDKVKKRKTS